MKLKLLILSSICFVTFIGCNNTPSSSENGFSSSSETNKTDKLLEIHSIEMKSAYGDATLIKYGDFEILVDAGERDDFFQVRKALDKYVQDGKLEMIINSHPHSDHIGGITTMIPFANIKNVDYIIDTGYNYGAFSEFQTKVADHYISLGAEQYKALDVINDPTLKDFKIDENLTLHFLNTGFYDQYETASNINNTSIAMYFEFGNTIIYMGGDGENSCENSIMSLNEKFTKPEQQVIFKASHHGSNGANSKAFLDYIDPDYIWCSAALQRDTLPNLNVHPYYDAISRMAEKTKNIYWNGINGNLNMIIDSSSNLKIEGEGRTLNYEYEDNGYVMEAPVEEEKNITYLNSKYYEYGIKNANWKDYRD